MWLYICFQNLNSQHIYSDFCFDQTRYLSHIGVRCVDVHLLDIWLSRLEFPTHRFWLLLWSNKKSRPYQCQMCGCTFAWDLAFKTWMPNTSILTFATATTKQKYRVFSLLYTEALAVARWIFISCAFKSSCQMEPFATHRAR